MADLLTKSDESWEAGQKCLDANLVNSAANRFYYAVFQAVREYAGRSRKLPFEAEDVRSIHAAILNVVGKGYKPRQFRQICSELRGLRRTADYYPEPVNRRVLESMLEDATSVRNHYLQKARNI